MKLRSLAICFLMLTTLPARADDVVYQIKAAYIYNFLQFITFESNATGGQAYLDVCVIDKDKKFGEALEHIAGQPTPQGKINIVLLSVSNKEKISSCHVLYLAGTDAKYTRKVLANTDTSRVLTIGENKAFIPYGGFIELFIEEDSVRFRINSDLAGQTRFKVSSQLLSLGVKS